MTTLERLHRMRVRLDRKVRRAQRRAARVAPRSPGVRLSPRVLQAQRRNAIFHQLHDVILGHPETASPAGVRAIEQHLGLGRASTPPMRQLWVEAEATEEVAA